MRGWTSEELSKIGTAGELRIGSLRRDGTLRSPTIIWVVRHGDDPPSDRRTDARRLVFGERSYAWKATSSGRGRQDVTFVSVEAADEVDAAIDAAYRAKYRRYPASYVDAS